MIPWDEPYHNSVCKFVDDQLKVKQKEIAQEKREEFSTDIKAEDQGVIKGGSISVDVKKSE